MMSGGICWLSAHTGDGCSQSDIKQTCLPVYTNSSWGQIGKRQRPKQSSIDSVISLNWQTSLPIHYSKFSTIQITAVKWMKHNSHWVKSSFDECKAAWNKCKLVKQMHDLTNRRLEDTWLHRKDDLRDDAEPEGVDLASNNGRVKLVRLTANQ